MRSPEKRYQAAGGAAPAQDVAGGRVQLFEQLAFPGVPHLGAGAADVGHGEQVQGGEVALVAHAACEGGDHVGVGQILLLRHLAHGEVLGHEEFNEPRVLARDAVRRMLAAKAPHFLRADL